MVKQEVQSHIPPCIDADSKLKRKKLPRTEKEGGRGMTRIGERLHIGGFVEAEEVAEDNPHGITTVVSLSEYSGRGQTVRRYVSHS